MQMQVRLILIYNLPEAVDDFESLSSGPNKLQFFRNMSLVYQGAL
jgi:hypothetical protein